MLTSDKKTDEKAVKAKAEKSKDLLKQGSELWATGFKPIQDVIVGKTDSSSTSETSSSNENVQITLGGKELIGEWGSYKGADFHKGLEFREDETFTLYDDSGKTSYEENHMEGTWFYSQDKKQVTMMPKEFVKDGKKIDEKQMEVAVDYKIEYFKDGSLKMVDTKKGNRITAERRK
ncbi:DUF3994 domain-containing protein [Bacillus mycoides]|uniref:DUF3994 domain-containing protein n=1 Tax=Bacillus mycoides TaxID=1405 RepID=UPI0011AA5E42